jgi:hypothetical protein
MSSRRHARHGKESIRIFFGGKMNIRTYAFLVAGSLLLAAIANAADVATAGKPLYVGTGINGEGLYVSIDQRLNSPCKSTNVFMATNAPQYKETFSMVLLALSEGKAITLYYDNVICTGGGNPVLLAVSVGP